MNRNRKVCILVIVAIALFAFLFIVGVTPAVSQTHSVLAESAVSTT